MFGMGMPEMIFIFIFALLVFGPRKLPEIGRTVGRLMGQMRRASEDFKRTWESEVDLESMQIKNPPRSPSKHPAENSQESFFEPLPNQSNPPEPEVLSLAKDRSDLSGKNSADLPTNPSELGPLSDFIVSREKGAFMLPPPPATTPVPDPPRYSALEGYEG